MSQIVGRLDRVIDVDADAEHVCEHRIAARQPQHPDAKRRRKGMRDDRHARGATGGAAVEGAASLEPVTQMRIKPPAIQAKSRTRPTIEAYSPTCGSMPKSLNSRKNAPSRAPTSNGTKKSALLTIASSPPIENARR